MKLIIFFSLILVSLFQTASSGCAGVCVRRWKAANRFCYDQFNCFVKVCSFKSPKTGRNRVGYICTKAKGKRAVVPPFCRSKLRELSKRASFNFHRLPPVLTTPHTSHRVGGWLTTDRTALKNYIKRLEAKITGDPLDTTVEAFGELINSSAPLYAGANLMISQVPRKYKKNPAGGPRLESVTQMLQLINVAISEPPPFDNTALVAFPINAILDWSMGTPAGWSFFLSERVNMALMAILNQWGKYLSSRASLLAFEDKSVGGGGWMSPEAVAKINMSMFVQPDPTALGWGYDSWNSWFIREFKAGMRPLAAPTQDKIIVSACESTPFALRHDVKLRDTFWIKSQPYSLEYMLAGDPRAPSFVGGTVYQAFLNAFNYHRWHSPVSGTIVHTKVEPGSYYAESPEAGFDPGAPNLSQGYISNVAARGVIFIEADNPVIGLMAVVTIGMAEVSSNVITVKPGQRVMKGEELGYFQYGGSSHCLVFRKDVIARWSKVAYPTKDGQIVPVNSYLATACD